MFRVPVNVIQSGMLSRTRLCNKLHNFAIFYYRLPVQVYHVVLIIEIIWQHVLDII